MRVNTTRWNRIRRTALAPLYDWIARFGKQRHRSVELPVLKPG